MVKWYSNRKANYTVGFNTIYLKFAWSNYNVLQDPFEFAKLKQSSSLFMTLTWSLRKWLWIFAFLVKTKGLLCVSLSMQGLLMMV